MSVSLWAYCPAYCDGDFCPGDCDHCHKADEAQEKQILEQPGYDFGPPYPASTPVITNYDRLISKTPEELAEAIYSVVDSCPRGKRPEFTCVANAYDCCACWLSWLKSPAEVDNG